MRDNIGDALNSMSGKKSNFSSEEIDRALKMKRKNGGTLLENLQAITGKTLPDSISVTGDSARIRKICENAGIEIDESPFKNSHLDSASELQNDIEEFTKNLQTDFGVTGSSSLGQQESALATSFTGQGMGFAGPDEPLKVDIESFKGIEDELNEKIYGQKEFIRKLLIAFKRPVVMAPEPGHARNSIYITGGECTGRHYTLKLMAEALEAHKIIRNGVIRYVDLSLYPTAGEEKLFLQDLYSALQSDNDIICFENYECCHTSLLANLSALVITGQCRLAARYVMQNGQLVGVNNALAADAVGALKASDKYLVFLSTRKLEKLVDAMGAPFVNALQGDVCQTEALDSEALTKVAENEKKQLEEDAKSQLFFELKLPEEFIGYAVSHSEKQAGLKGILDFYDDVFKALAQLRLERDLERGVPVTLNAKDTHMTCSVADESFELFSVLPGSYSGEIEAIRAELDNIVGLKEIKEYVLGLEEYYRVQQRRREEGLKASEVSKHMIFTGSPGTGKTTIARIISKYLKAIGVLTGGQLVEVSRADLVGRYVGHTAPLTNQVIQSAIGGVLFIDEAYSLYRGKDDSFGLEAIDTLVKGIEDNRENLIVILAGYSKEMETFLTSNSGLKSRFPNVINFPDYSGEELVEILKINAKSRGYSVDEGAEPALLAYFNAVQAVRAADAGNGRLARNKVEGAVLNQSRRLVAEPDADLSLLTSLDFDLEDING